MAYTTIDDPSAHFNTVLWSGNSSTQSITGVGFQPDFVWLKSRTNSASHRLNDSNRGVNKQLASDSTDDESSFTTMLTSFDSDGFTLGNNVGINGTGYTNVGWNWKANGGTTSSNSDGTITSTVQANTTAGFSIVTFTGTSSNVTTGHGLNQAPEIFFAKSRVSNSTNWNTYTSVIDGSLDYLFLNSTDAAGNASNSLPTSSVLYTNQTDSSVAYCFHSVKGYSKIGKYTANGNADGPFIYMGFKPAFVIFKRTDGGTSAWQMHDRTRETINDGSSPALKPNATDAEFSKNVDFLSNGIKIRDTSSDLNGGSGQTYIYMAFAEHPFVSSKGVPVTAR